MTIKILHPYHNNMLDVARALETIAQVEYLSYRVRHLHPDIRNTKPRTWGSPPIMYRPWHTWQLLRDTDYLIVKHMNDPLNFIPYTIAWLRRIPIIIVVQQLKNKQFPGYRLLFRLLTAWLNRRQAHVISLTREAYEKLRPLIRRLEYLPAAVDCRRFPVALHGTPASTPLKILTVGKWQVRKNLPLLLQAVRELQARHPGLPLHLTIIGKFTSEPASQDEYDNIRRLITKFSLTKAVELKVAVPYTNMPAHYNAADLFVLSASREPLGYAAVEAMAAGLPVIIGSDCGASSYVREGKNGYVFPDLSLTGLSACISEFVTKSDTVNWPKIQSMGKMSRKIAETEHAPARWVEVFHRLQADTKAP